MRLEELAVGIMAASLASALAEAQVVADLVAA